MLTRRTVLAGLGAVSILPRTASAGNYPERSLTLVVAYAAGGASDINARLQAKYLQQVIGVPVLIENVPGAGGLVAMKRVLADNDDHTLLSANSGMFIVLPHTNDSMDKNPAEQFTAVAKTRSFPTYLVVRKDSPYQTWEDLLSAAKANPGKLTYGSAGEGSSYHIAMAQLEKAAGLELVHVPYTGSAATTDLLSGRIDMAPMVPSGLAGHEEQLMPILNIDMTRTELRPEIRSATDVELENVTDFGWGAIYVAASVGAEKVKVLEDAFDKLNQILEYREAMLSMDTIPEFVPGKEWTALVAKQYDQMGGILTDLNLKMK